MKEIEIAIQEKLPSIPEKNREEWKKLSLSHAKLCLERGDSIERIINFIKS